MPSDVSKANSAQWTGAAHGVRPYLLTRGRTEPDQDYGLCLESLLTTRAAPGLLSPEDDAVLRFCAGTALSIAELASLMGQPVQVIKILAAELVGAGALSITGHQPDPAGDEQLLGDVLVGLRNLA
ncbi:DUF742 domain-containing protein [Streptomyces sp. MZ04]|uniref:DUF742 domain-containing protein n=1 Tax=Streptomyces sp. MZ04 TaxID=2559236 RepID=UPI001432BED7|nr:DUF742 domain-containing protein [Streptomyces sp. MZ04]